MSTPTGPKTPGAAPGNAVSRPSLEQTFLGVAPPAPPVKAPEPPPVAPAPAASAPPATPSRDAILAAPVISVSSKAAAGPITPRVAADSRAQPAPSQEPAPSEQTLMHPTPRAVGSPPSPSALRNPFPKPEPYAIPPRAGDGAARHPAGADRTALSAEYLRAAREAALGRSGNELRSNELRSGTTPSQRVLGSRAAFTTTPASRGALDQLRDESPQSFSTQQSLGSEPPPRAPGDAGHGSPWRAAAHGTVLEAPRSAAAPAPLPELPAVPSSERSPASSASRFEPVPAARTHLSDRAAATALSGQSLGHISVDWSPELADRARSAAPAPRSRAGRYVLLGVGALVLIALGFVTLGKPLRRLVSRVAGRAIETEVERAPAPVPSQTTLSNRPVESAPVDSANPPSEESPPTP